MDHVDYNNSDRKLTHEPNGKPEARTLEYFKNINQTVIQNLYEMYKIDFELFNYNMHGLTWWHHLSSVLNYQLSTYFYQTK